MKKLVALFVLVLCSTILFTTTAFATTFTVSDTDISIDIDDSVWYVFTRDNLQDNPELDELGITADYVYDVMQREKAYIDAILFYTDTDAYVELFVRKTPVEDILQLSDYPDSFVRELAKGLAERTGAEEHEIYKTDYKFTKMEYVQELEYFQEIDPSQSTNDAQPLSYTPGGGTATLTMYVMEYCTIVNGDNYTLTFQSEYPFIDEEYAMMDDIVDSVRFAVDPDLVDEITGFSMDWGRLGKAALEGAVIGGAVAGIAALVARKGKGKHEKGGKRLQKPSQKE